MCIGCQTQSHQAEPLVWLKEKGDPKKRAVLVTIDVLALHLQGLRASEYTECAPCVVIPSSARRRCLLAGQAVVVVVSSNDDVGPRESLGWLQGTECC